MPRRKGAPEVNAGSMADIAFLLLIFFLVTTTIETDAGLDRMLPPIEPPDTDVVIKQKNIFTVGINKNGQLLVEEQLMDLEDLRDAAIAFLDNGGAPSGSPDYCNYCKGKRDAGSSDNPGKAIISLKNDMEAEYLNPETPSSLRDDLKDKVKTIQDLFPQKLSEAETSNN